MYISGYYAFMAFFISEYLFNKTLKPLKKEEKYPLSVVVTAVINKMAILEGAAFFGLSVLYLYMSSPRIDPVPMEIHLTMTGMLLFAISVYTMFPTNKKILKWLNRHR